MSEEMKKFIAGFKETNLYKNHIEKLYVSEKDTETIFFVAKNSFPASLCDNAVRNFPNICLLELSLAQAEEDYRLADALSSLQEV